MYCELFKVKKQFQTSNLHPLLIRRGDLLLQPGEVVHGGVVEQLDAQLGIGRVQVGQHLLHLVLLLLLRLHRDLLELHPLHLLVFYLLAFK